jgi:hypothetical protein
MGSLVLLSPLQVGWNDAERYWLVRNSFGEDWADSGYFRVRRHGHCEQDRPAMQHQQPQVLQVPAHAVFA